MSKRKKTGIAFGGGATRGIAHIGVIKVLQEENLTFDYVAGNSAGSIIGALYAAGYSWQELYEMAKKLTPGDILGLNLKRKGLFKSEKLQELLESYFGDKTFADLKIPYRCVAVDLNTGNLVELSEGSLAKAVRASCSVPGVFDPTPYNDSLLVDGGILNSVPGDVALKMGAEFVVAVNLNSDRGRYTDPKNGFDVIWSALKIAWHENTVKSLKDVQVVIAPDLSDYTYYDLKHLDKMVEIGEQAAREKLPHILKGFGR